MTEKRFTLFDDGETIIDNETVADDGGKQIYWTVEYVQMREVVKLLNELHEENKELKRINQDYISSLEEEKNNLQIKLRKIMDYAMEDGEVKQGVIEKVMCE